MLFTTRKGCNGKAPVIVIGTWGFDSPPSLMGKEPIDSFYFTDPKTHKTQEEKEKYIRFWKAYWEKRADAADKQAARLFKRARRVQIKFYWHFFWPWFIYTWIMFAEIWFPVWGDLQWFCGHRLTVFRFVGRSWKVGDAYYGLNRRIGGRIGDPFFDWERYKIFHRALNKALIDAPVDAFFFF